MMYKLAVIWLGVNSTGENVRNYYYYYFSYSYVLEG